jgi:hypothetical protein
MKRKKLEQLKAECERLRRIPSRSSEFQSLAAKLGRAPVKRGKEPMWESEKFAHLRALSIPSHAGRDIPIGTARSIITQLEEDVEAWEALLSEGDDKGIEQ